MQITTRRRVLGAGLRGIREQAGLSAERAAELSGYTPVRVGAAEEGSDPAIRSSAAKLLDVYAVPEPTRARILELAQEANVSGWWNRAGDSELPPGFAAYLALESTADSIKLYENRIMPGLFQTAEYARTLMRSFRPAHDPRRIENLIQVRMGRRAIFDRPNAPYVHVILCEDALWRGVGGADVSRRQLEALADWIDAGAVTVQLLPAMVPDAGHNAPFHLFGFDRPRGQVVAVESVVGVLYLDSPEEVLPHRAEFDHLTACALSPSTTRRMIGETIESLESREP
ncbi:helix-turn-helix domain-containing protein [Longispora urticae]